MYDYFTYEMGRIKTGRNRKELERLRPMLADMRDAFRAAEKSGGVRENRT
jgi:flagellar protein FliS